MISRAISCHYHIDVLNELDLISFAKIDAAVPRIRFVHDQLERPVHWSDVSVHRGDYGAKPIVLLARDPRDVVVSTYYQNAFRENYYDGDLESFVREDEGSFLTLLHFYRKWTLERSASFDWHLVRYEDLRENAVVQLERVLNVLGLSEVSGAVVEEAVEYAAFDNMRRMELSGQFDGRLRPRDARDERTFKTRKGKVGGFRAELSGDTVSWMEEQMKRLLPSEFGYFPNVDS